MEYPRIIYAIQHNPTGRVYIGSSCDGSSRIASHMSMLRTGKHPNKMMQADFDKFGDDYSVCFLDVVVNPIDRNKEFLWMDALNTRDPENGYNGGDHSIPAQLSRLNFRSIPNGTLGDFRRELTAWEKEIKRENLLDPDKRGLFNLYPSAFRRIAEA